MLPRAQLHPPEVEDIERNLVPFSDRAEHVSGWDVHVVQQQGRGRRPIQAELPFVRPAHHTHRPLDQEGRESFAVDFREDGEQISQAAVGDPGLLAVEHVVPAVGREPGARARGEGVGPGLRLGKRVGADQVCAPQPGKISSLLLVGAEVDDRQRADGGMRAKRSRKRRVDRNLLADIRRADLVEAEAAVGRGDFEAGEIEPAALRIKSRVSAQSCA